MQTEILVVLRVAAFRADSSNNREWNVQVGTGTIKASTQRERAGLLRAHQPAITARKSLQDNCAALQRCATQTHSMCGVCGGKCACTTLETVMKNKSSFWQVKGHSLFNLTGQYGAVHSQILQIHLNMSYFEHACILAHWASVMNFSSIISNRCWFTNQIPVLVRQKLHVD